MRQKVDLTDHLNRPIEQGNPTDFEIALNLVDKLLGRVPENDRTVLVLKELQDYSVEEIVEILNRSS